MTLTGRRQAETEAGTTYSEHQTERSDRDGGRFRLQKNALSLLRHATTKPRTTRCTLGPFQVEPGRTAAHGSTFCLKLRNYEITDLPRSIPVVWASRATRNAGSTHDRLCDFGLNLLVAYYYYFSNLFG